MTSIQDEQIGRIVRAAWVEWAKEQPDPKESWLTPWNDLDEGQREVDIRIGQAVAAQAAYNERARIRSLLPYNVNCCEGFPAAVADMIGEHGDSPALPEDPEGDALDRVRRLAASWAALSEHSTLPADEVTAHVGRMVLDVVNVGPYEDGDLNRRLASVAAMARRWMEPGGSFTYPSAGQHLLNALSGVA